MFGFKQKYLWAAIFAFGMAASGSLDAAPQNIIYSAHGLSASALVIPSGNRVMAQVTVHNNKDVTQYISYCALVQSGRASLTDGRMLMINTDSIGGISSHYASQMGDCLKITEAGQMTPVEPSGTVKVSISWYDGNGSGREITPDLSMSFPFNFAVRTGSSNRIEAASILFPPIQLRSPK